MPAWAQNMLKQNGPAVCLAATAASSGVTDVEQTNSEASTKPSLPRCQHQRERRRRWELGRRQRRGPRGALLIAFPFLRLRDAYAQATQWKSSPCCEISITRAFLQRPPLHNTSLLLHTVCLQISLNIRAGPLARPTLRLFACRLGALQAAVWGLRQPRKPERAAPGR